MTPPHDRPQRTDASEGEAARDRRGRGRRGRDRALRSRSSSDDDDSPGCTLADATGCSSSPGRTLSITDPIEGNGNGPEYFTCRESLLSVTHADAVVSGSGWPVKVRISFPPGRVLRDTDGFSLSNRCEGDGDPDTIDLVVEIEGDGRTRGFADDAFKVKSRLDPPGGIQVTGSLDCGPAPERRPPGRDPAAGRQPHRLLRRRDRRLGAGHVDLLRARAEASSSPARAGPGGRNITVARLRAGDLQPRARDQRRHALVGDDGRLGLPGGEPGRFAGRSVRVPGRCVLRLLAGSPVDVHERGLRRLAVRQGER